MFYPEDIVEEVRTKNDIVDIVSGYVKLQKKGSNYFGLCPFHNEKSPSFSVSPSKQMYYCFGCGAGGNAITFLMEYENYSFPEALQVLADRAGVELPKEEMTKEARAQADLRATLLEINKLAANYFYYQLKQPQGKLGYDYLTGRKLSDATILHFGLGFANKTSDDLYRYLKSKGYKDEILKETGLVSIEERGTHDKFWNRVMFPIMDVNNRVIGFGGRVMGDGTPKYLNSPETRLFDKSRNLYGLNYARSSRKKYMLICEGYMDVIAMHQAGFTNAVASLGTAFTSQHAMLIKRYTDQVILTYDSDGAGVKAALRAIPILKEVGISCKVLNMKPYKDPDEFIKNMGAEAFQERIDQAQNSFLFEIEVLKRDYNLEDPEQKTNFYNAVARKLLEFPEALERDNYTQAVAREQFIPYQELKQLVSRLSSRIVPGAEQTQPREEFSPRERKKEKEDGARQSQRLLLTWLIEDPKLFDKIEGIITPDDFREDLYHQVAQMVFDGHARGDVNPAGILNHFINDEEQYKEVAALFNASLKESLNNEEQKKAFSETVIKVRKHSLDEASRNASDIETLQKIIQAQSALKTLHISLD
ncbi:MAG: DNA primase [Lachnospiraceae bacterium]|jgi:DNA primase|nr:DNA primase [Lachnospiraceae bacterium AM48-27BH]